jgi:uncharacterized protein (DUF305 family)
MHCLNRAAMTAIAVVLPFLSLTSPSPLAAQSATPTVSCESAAAAPPMSGMDGMAMGTPAAGSHDMAGQQVEFDQLYIDMMVPHHESIIALAQVARDRLTDARLQAIADTIVTDQTREIEQLRGYRDMFYGDPRPMPMDEQMMAMMMEQMPGIGDIASMQMLMDPNTLVATFCRADDPDLAFIDLVIPHHEMAIQASEAVVDRATHEEIRTIAQNVIAAQQQEVTELQTIRADLSGKATPASA